MISAQGLPCTSTWRLAHASTSCGWRMSRIFWRNKKGLSSTIHKRELKIQSQIFTCVFLYHFESVLPTNHKLFNLFFFLSTSFQKSYDNEIEISKLWKKRKIWQYYRDGPGHHNWVIALITLFFLQCCFFNYITVLYITTPFSNILFCNRFVTSLVLGSKSHEVVPTTCTTMERHVQKHISCGGTCGTVSMVNTNISNTHCIWELGCHGRFMS